MSKIAIIGSGFSGLSAACFLAKEGHDVHVFEKNSSIGGRARQYSTSDNFVFDMGPSWYWMPGVFDNFFKQFDKKTSDFYELTKLNPSFDVVYKDETISIPSDFDELCTLFESIEKGSAEKLKLFMKEAAYKYDTGMQDFVYKPSLSITEFIDWKIMIAAFKLQIFSSFSKHVKKYFKNPKLISLMEFPVLFLGAMPQDTPALYSLMNYAGLVLGTWYPKGGFASVINAMEEIAIQYGVTFHIDSNVDSIEIDNDKITGLKTKDKLYAFDALIASADYQHVENSLLPEKYRNYKNSYWDSKIFAPSSLIFYVGLNEKIDSIHHHTLFFEEELYQHSVEIYKDKKWPSKPLFYLCCPSKTDSTVAPDGKENLFFLMPLAPGIEDTEELREKYFDLMWARLEKICEKKIKEQIIYKKSYCIQNFIDDYNSYKGNAYGLANTLTQTAFMKPSMKNHKLSNMFYAGQLTVPGPGVPPSIISGQMAAELTIKYLSN